MNCNGAPKGRSRARVRACQLRWPVCASQLAPFSVAKGILRAGLGDDVDSRHTSGSVSHTFRSCDLLEKQRYRRDLQ